MADTSKVGVAGHSWGAIATLVSALANKKEVKAAFSLHPCPCATSGSVHGLCGNLDFKVPIAYITGTADSVCSPSQVESYYSRSKGANKAIANLKVRKREDVVREDKREGVREDAEGKMVRLS
jgi:dienelactone hydrolase